MTGITYNIIRGLRLLLTRGFLMPFMRRDAYAMCSIFKIYIGIERAHFMGAPEFHPANYNVYSIEHRKKNCVPKESDEKKTTVHHFSECVHQNYTSSDAAADESLFRCS